MKKTLKALLAAIMVIALAATSFVVPVSAAKTSENSVGHVFEDRREKSNDKRAVLILALFKTKTDYAMGKGSGFVFGRNAVMTAAHVIYDRDFGGFAKKIYVLPENYEKDISFYQKDDGSWDLKVPKTAYTVKDFEYNSKIIGTSDIDNSWRWENDWAILKTNGNIGDKYGYYEFSTGVSKSDTLTVTGFPGDKQEEKELSNRYNYSFSRWTESKEKAILDINNQFIDHTVSITPGSSGGPTLVNKNTAVGVLVSETTEYDGYHYHGVCNTTTRITDSIYKRMLKYGKHFHVNYNANGGSGSMAATTVWYGVDTPLRANSFKKTGYHFTGWTVKRKSDNKWLYQNPSDTSKKEWCFENKQRSGWKKFKYNNQQHVAWTSPVHDDTVVMNAQWEANTYTVKYQANGGTGSMANTVIKFGTYTPLRKNTFKCTFKFLNVTRSLYFAGWCAQRSSDGKWHYINPDNNSQDGWYKVGSQPAGWKKFIYFDGEKLAKTTSVDKDTVTMYAQWNIFNIGGFHLRCI